MVQRVIILCLTLPLKVLILTGLQVGLLPAHNFQQVSFAYEMYKREDKEGIELSEQFKRTFCRHVYIDFLGVWYASDCLVWVTLINTLSGTRWPRLDGFRNIYRSLLKTATFGAYDMLYHLMSVV